MFASSVLSRRATSPAPAQRKNCLYFLTSSRWDLEKTNVVFRRSPDRGIHQVKKQKKIYTLFFAFVRVCQLSTSTYHVCHVCAEIPDMGRSVVSLSCVVEYLCLASPGPSRTILSRLGVLACVLGFCLQGCVSIASI